MRSAETPVMVNASESNRYGLVTGMLFLWVCVLVMVIPVGWAAGFAAVSSHGQAVGSSHASARLSQEAATGSTAGQELLSQAEQSLGQGLGPASGKDLQCTPESGGASYSCGAGPGSVLRPIATAGLNWTMLQAGEGRYMGTMVYDAADGYVLLFGGTNTTTSMADTWKFSAGSWAPIVSGAAPSARFAASMAYDPIDGYVVLFGGDNQYTMFNDTWAFSGGEWTDLNLSYAPGIRAAATMTFDAADGYVLLFGGAGCYGGLPCNITGLSDTWTFVGGAWSELQQVTAPPARDYASMTYDASDGYVVLFGGQKMVCPGGSCTLYHLQDTWTFTGGTWTNLSLLPAVSPGTRVGGAMAYDAVDGYVVLFGGLGCSTGSSCSAAGLQDTWKFVGGAWTELLPATYPGIRYGEEIAYDPADGYVVLLGGAGCSSGSSCIPSLVQDTWTFVAGNWMPASPPSIPGIRLGAAMVYDATDGYVLLFGGYGCSTGSSCTADYLQDTWTFAGGEWSELSPSASPGIRAYASISFDWADEYVLLFGGYGCGTGSTCTQGYLQDTWTFQGGTWSELTPATSPGTRFHSAMAFDVADDYVVLFAGWGCSTGSGCTAGVLQDTWTFVGGVWTQLTPATSPGERQSSVMAYDEAAGYVVLFSGFGCSTGSSCTGFYLQDTWEFVGGTWTELEAAEYGPRAYTAQCYLYSAGLNSSTLTPCPVVRTTRSMDYDSADGAVFLFGGTNAAGDLEDTWEYAAGVWKMPGPIPPPGIRTGAALAYDPQGEAMVLFGGDGCSKGSTCTVGYLQDTWEFSSDWWTELSPSTPGARVAAMMTYDPVDGYVVLFGGYGCSTGSSCTGGYLQDTWTFAYGQWTLLYPTTSPGARDLSGMVYDAIDREVVLYGGFGCTTGNSCTAAVLADTWTFVGGQWTSISPATYPGAREAMTMTYDVADNIVLLFGGNGCATGATCATPAYLQDTWKFVGGAWTSLTPAASPGIRAWAMMSYDTALGYVVLFGGFGCNTGSACAQSFLQDTWTFTAGAWNQLTISTPPGQRDDAAMVYDATNGYIVLSGGIGCSTGTTCTASNLQDTWQFRGGGWTELSPTGIPGARYEASMSYDATDRYVLLLGGFGCSVGNSCTGAALSDTWNFGIPLVDQAPTQSVKDLELGQSVVFHANATGGGGPANYSFEWSGLPTGCYTNMTTANLSCTPTGAGLFMVSTVVYDSSDLLLANGGITLVYVATALAAPSTPTVNATALDANQELTVQSTLSSTGVSPYNWTWLVSVDGGSYAAATQCATDSGTGAAGGATEKCIVAPNTLIGGDIYNFILEVSDNAAVPVTVQSFPSPTLHVNDMLSAGEPTPLSSSIDAGQGLLITNAAAGGTAPLTWQWYDPASPGACSSSSPAISGATSSAYTTPTTLTAGTYYFCYEVSDSSGAGVATAYSTTDTLTVGADPTVSVTPTGPLTYNVSQTAAGLTAAITYSGQNTATVEWYGSVSATCGSASTDMKIAGTTFTPPTTSAGTEYYCAVVSDSGVTGYASASNAVEVIVKTVGTPLSITSFKVSPSPVVVDSWTNFTVSASGGTGTLSYSYAGLPSGCPTADVAFLPCRPTSAGSFNVTVTVSDMASHSVNKSVSLVVTQVPGGPSISSFAASPSSVTVGSATTLTVVASGGTGTLTYAYAGLPSGCSTSNTASLSCTPSATGTFNVVVWVNDSAGHSATRSTTLTVTKASGSSSSSSWITLLIVIIVVVMVAVLVAVLLIARKRKRNNPPPMTGAPAPGAQPPAPPPSAPVQMAGTSAGAPPPAPAGQVLPVSGAAPVAASPALAAAPAPGPVAPSPPSPPAAVENTRPCPYCGVQNQRESSNCQKCGKTLPAPLYGTDPVSPAPPPQAAPASGTDSPPTPDGSAPAWPLTPPPSERPCPYCGTQNMRESSTCKKCSKALPPPL